ncbi:hypothetical protein [Flagellimonas meridianipacifica]|uniref:Uncharacterized protein n=1 Tax=Flagellimonas meridianipacifica TaxID=1080225 RepID=A0A2T0MAT1_9FLAO|nr:hypothetical protein [Allomuricauda pacifica]PRX54614.1 hypothetical protein CLV81_3016 [Allomuricauda pacifica]
MLFWKTENKIEPKREFYSKIEEYYVGIADEHIPTDLLYEIISKVTDHIYSNYKGAWKKYPKSRKRYSTLKMEDIEHPFIQYLITDFLEEKNIPKYKYFLKVLFKMNDSEFEEYRKRKNWYETQ